MATGRSTQLAGQVGEYLVAAELCRQNLIAATFSGNVEHFDILASDSSGKAFAVQVKTIRTGDWQMNIKRFLRIEQRGKIQISRGPTPEPRPGLICVFVRLGAEYRTDEFFVLTWLEVQRITVKKYLAYLKKFDGVRPRNPESLHTSLVQSDIAPYMDAWHIFAPPAQPEAPIIEKRTRRITRVRET